MKHTILCKKIRSLLLFLKSYSNKFCDSRHFFITRWTSNNWTCQTSKTLMYSCLDFREHFHFIAMEVVLAQIPPINSYFLKHFPKIISVQINYKTKVSSKSKKKSRFVLLRHRFIRFRFTMQHSFICEFWIKHLPREELLVFWQQ